GARDGGTAGRGRVLGLRLLEHQRLERVASRGVVVRRGHDELLLLLLGRRLRRLYGARRERRGGIREGLVLAAGEEEEPGSSYQGQDAGDGAEDDGVAVVGLRVLLRGCRRGRRRRCRLAERGSADLAHALPLVLSSRSSRRARRRR